MNTAKVISGEQMSLEHHVHELIERRDPNVLADYASYVEEHVESELVRHLLLAILDMDDRRWGFILAEIGTNSSPLRGALKDCALLLEKHREAFIESAALALLSELKGEDQ